MTKLAAKLPEGQQNGLVGLDKRLSDDPEAVHTVVAAVDVSKITTDVDTGDVEPTLRIREIHLLDGEDAEQVNRIVQQAAGMLPIDEDQDDVDY